MSDHLLHAGTTDDYRDTVLAGMARVTAAVTGATRPFSGATQRDLAGRIGAVDLDSPVGDVEGALTELDDLYLRDAVWFHHPRYLAHLNCPVAIPALMADAIGSAVNSSMDTWDQSAGATLIERRLVDWTAGRLGFPTTADGVFTSGGTQSNLQALLIAREAARSAHAAATAQAPDPRPLTPRLRILASAVGHFSVTRAAGWLGLDDDAVISIPCDASLRMIPEALDAELDRCRRLGLVPMAVVATAGTTDFGSIDPLQPIARLCERDGVWFHVDAAYGCGLLVSRRRSLLAGIECADSVTVDFHKAFFQPVASSAVIVRDGRTLGHVTHRADYLNPERHAHREVPDQVDKSLATTRRFDALKLWLTLRVMGAETIGAMFDQVVDLAAQAWEVLDADPRFEVVVRPTLSTLVFRYVPPGPPDPELADRIVLHVREALFATGEAVVAGTTVDGRHHLKFTLLNPTTTLADIRAVLESIADQAATCEGCDLDALVALPEPDRSLA